MLWFIIHNLATCQCRTSNRKTLKLLICRQNSHRAWLTCLTAIILWTGSSAGWCACLNPVGQVVSNVDQCCCCFWMKDDNTFIEKKTASDCLSRMSQEEAKSMPVILIPYPFLLCRSVTAQNLSVIYVLLATFLRDVFTMMIRKCTIWRLHLCSNH